MRIGMLQNEPCEGPGLFGELLRKAGADITLFHRTDAGWPALVDLDGLLVFGGPMSANDDDESIRRELAYVLDAVAQDVPYLGLCLGLQMLVKACGGVVKQNRVREAGFRDSAGLPYAIELTEEGKKDPLLAGLKSPVQIFHAHGETVELTEGMLTLGIGKHCEQQIVRVGKRAYGFQGHPEMTPAIIHEWKENDSMIRALDKDQLREDMAEFLPALNATCATITKNFLGMVNNP